MKTEGSIFKDFLQKENKWLSFIFSQIVMHWISPITQTGTADAFGKSTKFNGAVTPMGLLMCQKDEKISS